VIRAGRIAALVAVVASACDRGHREPVASAPVPAPVPAAATTPAAPPQPAACSIAPREARHTAPHRVVAIGDLHGDLAALRAALRTAGAIDEHDAWIGGDLVVVQTGDVLDRGDDESAMLELLDRLAHDAPKTGGAIIQLLGNHELMNAAHDFRYVTPGGMRDFGGDRAHQLAPGGAWARRLANLDVIAIVGDAVLSHAGVLGDYADHVDDINREARCWLDGQRGEPPAVLTGDDTPVWTRELGVPGREDCARLAAALDRLHAKRMIVAHTVQASGITSACDGALWRIDVGLAKLYGGPIEVLELGEPPHILRGQRLL